MKGMTYILISVLLGWWGIPWGPIWTIQSLYINLKGGKDITSEVLKLAQQVAPGSDIADLGIVLIERLESRVRSHGQCACHCRAAAEQDSTHERGDERTR